MQKLNEILNGWFKGEGKPNSVNGEWSIDQVINYRVIMGMSHNLQVYTALKDEKNWDKIKHNMSRNEKGDIKQIKRQLKQRQWECI